MDPIHPIVPVTPGLTPVEPAGGTAPLRDQAERHQRGDADRRRQRQQAQTHDVAGYWDPSDTGDDNLAWDSANAEDEPGEDDGHRHIDITA